MKTQSDNEALVARKVAMRFAVETASIEDEVVGASVVFVVPEFFCPTGADISVVDEQADASDATRKHPRINFPSLIPFTRKNSMSEVLFLLIMAREHRADCGL